MLNITFEGEPDSGKALPEGEYLLAPVFFSLRESRSGSPYMQIDYVVMDGEHAGKGLFGQSVFFSKNAQRRTISLIQTMHAVPFTAKGQSDFFKHRFGRPFIGNVKLKQHYNDADRKVLELDTYKPASDDRINEMRQQWNDDRSIIESIQEYIRARFELHNGFAAKDNREQEKYSKKTVDTKDLPKYIQVLVPDEPILVSQPEPSPSVDFADDFAGDEDIPF